MKTRSEINKEVNINPDWVFAEIFPTISAYTTAYNCIKNGYPIIEAIRSFSWCDEVIVVDGGSDDDTVSKLEELAKEIPQLQVYEIPLDWNNPGKDGAQKAMSRAMCTSDISIQFDADEICIGDVQKWKKLAKDIPADILELPVLEPYGELTKLRLNKGHNPSKWRLFRNKSEITHGIPKPDRQEEGGKVFSRGGSDGCFPIHIVSEELYPSRMTYEGAVLKRNFLNDHDAYEENVKELLKEKRPAILHVGHLNLEKKIHLFLSEWRKWWADLYGKDPTDISMFFQDKTLEDVNDDDILVRAKEMATEVDVVEIPELKEYEGLLNGTQGDGV